MNWKLDEQIYREYVLSPEINFQPSTFNPQPPDDFGWRRVLWEHFYPRIRKESSLEAVAEIVERHLNETCRRLGDETNHPLTRPPATLTPSDGERGTTPDVVAYNSVLEIWRQQEASDAEFARVCVAAWRAVGIPARLGASGSAEFWTGTEWKEILRPVAADKELRGTKSFTRARRVERSDLRELKLRFKPELRNSGNRRPESFRTLKLEHLKLQIR